MTSAEFYDMVRETLNRGSTLNGVLPQFIQMSLRQIEQSYPFSFLDWWADATLKKGEQIINLPIKIRNMEFLRMDENPDGDVPKWHYLSKMDDPKQTINRRGVPERYWINKRACLVLDAIPERDWDIQIRAKRYTEFPAETSTEPHWALSEGTATTALWAYTMFILSQHIREDDPNLRQGYGQIYQQALNNLISEEAQFEANAAPTEMIYWPEHIPLDKAFREH